MKVEGFFRNIKNANEAVKKLNSEGFKNAYVDLNDDNINERNLQTNLPGSTNSPSLSNLVLRSGGVSEEDVSPIAAASPMVSGMGGFEEITDINCKVVVETDSNEEKRVRDIISSMGGHFKNPSLDLGSMVEVKDELHDALDDVMS
ncbi:hypothetical protein [Fonticella tunisiensis]|uniref:Heat induced stress protein YflT n=1 Tax=Fonticella tunisiensis TaxID=1096341 RepID=A0A4R7KBZ8_9CLOT|nr:hypothetical protein [Fonticella tunisiensis]TDT52078.1 hypothetical protein EDD71_11459 [Fonticella tunisiensis]